MWFYSGDIRNVRDLIPSLLGYLVFTVPNLVNPTGVVYVKFPLDAQATSISNNSIVAESGLCLITNVPETLVHV